MKKVAMPIIILVMIGAFLAISWAKQPKVKTLVEKEKVGVTLISVYDNYQVNPELKTDWG